MALSAYLFFLPASICQFKLSGCFLDLVSAYSHDPDELGNYYLQHRELMQHWCNLLPDFIHVVQFEELLQDPEKQVNALLDFCGLPREANTLDTATLPTAENSVGGWQHYREPLKPLFDILESS